MQIDSQIYNIDEPPIIDKNKKHDIEIVVDRLVVNKDLIENKQRIADSVETCLSLADGITYVDYAATKKRIIFSASI